MNPRCAAYIINAVRNPARLPACWQVTGAASGDRNSARQKTLRAWQFTRSAHCRCFLPTGMHSASAPLMFISPGSVQLWGDHGTANRRRLSLKDRRIMLF